ncbi:NAD(P)H-quinone oxidoreductase [Crenobacter sp. SG2303]|uniref:NAD(P)H-quinone oxidoreductase n=1 Tax=Crenobacter oryzisoli TaxID=3056844 RepID=A0ABT7XI94_9NEIS|nr:NAD(P)H-quinone oxidoreductase [Crenobacter sp. SG2303]MDN0073503.1 NAD(P)H-quinone oxidoreductase [Crenobacter sp. SG2303]
MHAILQTQPGDADTLYLGSVERPQAGPGQLLVKVNAAGVNRADIVQREGRYPPPPGASSILGLELAGVVVEAGDGCRFRAGDAVFGLVGGGAYAEYALLDDALAIAKPAWLSWAEAASLPEAWLTAILNLIDVGQLKAGESFLVHAGASGVGAAAIQLAKQLGARVFASAGSASKLAYCRRLGADEVFNYKEQSAFGQWIKERGGVDLVLDPIGASHIDENITALRRDGRLVVIGVMGGSNGQLNLGQLLMKRLRVQGSTLRSQPLEVKAQLTQRLSERLDDFRSGRLRFTLDSRFDIADVAAAHRHMESNANLGKIVLEWPAA